MHGEECGFWQVVGTSARRPCCGLRQTSYPGLPITTVHFQQVVIDDETDMRLTTEKFPKVETFGIRFENDSSYLTKPGSRASNTPQTPK